MGSDDFWSWIAGVAVFSVMGFGVYRGFLGASIGLTPNTLAPNTDSVNVTISLSNYGSSEQVDITTRVLGVDIPLATVTVDWFGHGTLVRQFSNSGALDINVPITGTGKTSGKIATANLHYLAA